MSAPRRPPGWAERLLSVLTPRRYRDEQLGDLQEGFSRRIDDPAAARRWYVRQVLRSVPATVRMRLRRHADHGEGRAMGMESIAQDLRYGLRSLRRSPGFAVVATLTLALAIGVNTSIFSLVSVIVFADLPMQEAETVALLRSANAELDIDLGSMSPADYMDLVERSRSFESLSALTEAQWVLTGAGEPERVEGLQVTADLIETWRLPPVLGRGFAEGEDRWGAPPVAMLTYGYWQDRFGGRPDVLGEVLRLDGREHTVVGVTDPRLEFASFRTARVLTPLILNRGQPNRAARYLLVSGRLAPGVTHEVATQETERIGRELADEHPAQNRGWVLRSDRVLDSLVDDTANTILLMLQLTVAMVILIACANVANMLLARATAREREISVRAALGAERARLVRQLLTESVVISLGAAVLGLGLAHVLNRALIWISAGTEEVFLMAELDGRVLLFTLAVSLAAPLVFGLLPALRTSAPGASAALRDGRSTDGGRRAKRARGALVSAQVALALTLMVVAGLVTRSVIALESTPLGFDPAGLITVGLTVPETAYEEPADRVRFYRELREALESVPGLDDTQITNVVAGTAFGPLRSMRIEGVELPEGRAAPTANLNIVSTGYFDLVGLALLGGRGFTDADGPDAPPVAVVSRALASRFWPNEDPVGRRVQIVDADAWLEVVGMVSDVRGFDPTGAGAPNLYLPHAQDGRAQMFAVARTDRGPSELAGPLRDAVWSVDADQPVDAIRTMERAQYEANASSIALVTLFVTFAVFALLMAAIGIYGVMAYSVSQRRGEIGLRLALGAAGPSVLWLVVGHGARLVGVGMVVGLGASLLLSRLLANVVFGIATTDAVTFVGVPVVLALVAFVANLIPARRALRLDPATTLRVD